MKSGKVAARCALSTVTLFLPAAARAHTTIQGMNEFVSGAAHPILTPAHVLIVIGLGLLAGQQPFSWLKMSMIGLMAASALALGLTTMTWVTAVYPPALISFAFILGVFVAADLKAPVWSGILIFVIGGTVIGLDSKSDAGSRPAMVKTLIGTWASLALLVFDIAYYASMGIQRKKWLAIGVRVIGSWILAISVLMLAFFLKRK
jgi:hydrogenase/urease accessory protein HupE